MQLGRLRDGALGVVLSGQFRPFRGEPNGSCGRLRSDGYFIIAEQRAQPVTRTVVYGLVLDDAPVVIRLDGKRTTLRPGALGAYVAVFAGLRDLSKATITLSVDGRRLTRRLGR